MSEKKYISIDKCDICKKIPQKKSVDDSQTKERIPKEVDELEILTDNYRKCSECGTYYYYNYYYDKGEPMILASNNYTIARLTPRSMLKLFEHPNVEEKDKEAFNNEAKELKNRYTKLMGELTDILKNKFKRINWQIKKYLIESLTDHLLDKDSWPMIREVLLKHEDIVVRVEAAHDLLIIATEEYPVWSVRHFSSNLKEKGKKLLSIEKGKAGLELVDIFIEGYSDKTRTYEIDPIGYDKYRKITVSYVSYWGLNNAIYRGIDISEAIPMLLKKLIDEDKWYRTRSRDLIKDYIEKEKENVEVVANLIVFVKGESEEFTEIQKLVDKGLKKK